MTKTVHLFIGIPGSGKSHTARSLLTERSVMIERDEIREELSPGYYKGKPNRKVEKQTTAIARERLNKALADESIEDIFLSDTNLNEAHKKELLDFIGDRAKINTYVMPESYNLELCLRRNLQREKVVPEEVLIRFWKSFMAQFDLDPMNKSLTRPLLFVSDIHSQHEKLEQVIDFYGTDTYYYVFLGDLNDSRTSSSNHSFLRTYQLVKELVDTNYKATLIHSNHQKNIISAIRGRRKKTGYGLEKTLQEMQDANLMEVTYADNGDILSVQSSREALDMANWLDSRPYYFQKEGVRAVHAQYLDKECNHPYDVSGRGQEAAIYGTKMPRTDEVKDYRIAWWKTYSESLYVVAGHYHEVYMSDYCAVIDAGCGQDNGQLAVLNYETKELKLF